MRVTDRIRTGDFYGCARPCAPGAIWETPYHSDPDCGGDCPSGSFCEAGQPPTPCVHGTYNPAPKATTRDNCIPCRPGTYNNLQGANGSSYCIPCPPGSLSEVVGAAFCDACPAGGYCSSEGAATVRQTYTPCQAGTYNPSTGSKGNTSCLACPSGKANPTPGSSSADDCHECLPGSVAPRNGTAICNLCVPGKRQSAQGQVSCLDCTEGSFCVQGSVLPAPCLAGTHSNSTGLTSAAECTMTNPGFFSPTGSIAPTPCAAGTVSPGWGSNVCMQCEPGKYQGAAGQTACEPCASGVYCKAAATQPVPCPSGRFSNSSRLASAASCEVCPLGYACATGASYPQKCTAGRYGDQPEQQGIQCSGPCREGHFCPEGSTSSSANACPEGTYNRVLGGETVDACVTCQLGQSSQSGSAQCTLCAKGYFRQHAHLPASECSSCDAIRGVQCDGNATITTFNMTAGYWRHSTATAETHFCKSDGSWSPCQGGADAGAEGNGYCAEGYRGPRCELCDGPAYTRHFDKLKARCRGCGDMTARAAPTFVITMLLFLAAYFGIRTATHYSKGSNACPKLLRAVLGAQAIWRDAGMRYKGKLLVGLYQCLSAVPSAFNVMPPLGLEEYTRWIDLIEMPSELENIFVPTACIGDYRSRLLLGSLWPFGLV
eukprot:2692841-Prymnesium_polylepis.1